MIGRIGMEKLHIKESNLHNTGAHKLSEFVKIRFSESYSWKVVERSSQYKEKPMG
jgi:hypothetical protein